MNSFEPTSTEPETEPEEEETADTSAAEEWDSAETETSTEPPTADDDDQQLLVGSRATVTFESLHGTHSESDLSASIARMFELVS